MAVGFPQDAPNCSRASSRRRPWQIELCWMDHTPRLSLRTTSGPMSCRRNDNASSVSSRLSTSNSSEIASCSTAASSRFALARQRKRAWLVHRRSHRARKGATGPTVSENSLAFALLACGLLARFGFASRGFRAPASCRVRRS